MTAKRSDLKQQLLEQARRRSTSRTSNAPSSEKGAEQRSVPERFTRFDAQPGYQQIAMMRQAAEQLGLIDPFFKVHEGTAGATSVINGHTCINFASYNYLGFSGDPRINQAACDAVARYGTSVSASRVVSGERPIHQELEQALAKAYDVEDAVAFVSGHATNVSTLGYLVGPERPGTSRRIYSQQLVSRRTAIRRQTHVV